MGRSTKKTSATTKTETAAVTDGAVAKTATVVAAPTSALANAFAQSAAFFKKKESYAPAVVDEPVVEAKPKKESTKKATFVPTETEIETQAKLEKKQRKKDKRKARIAEEKAKKAEATESAAKDESTESTEAADAEEVEPVGEDSTADAATKSDRTVFVGNVSLDATQSAVKQFFSSCGKVETVRLRFLPVAGTAVNDHGNQKLVAKVCANKKIFTDKRDFCHAYVTFANQASVAKALKLNHASFMEKTIRVDHENPVVDPHRSVFVGNLSFHVTDEAVWTFFDKQLKTEDEPHPVENVRVIRDRETGAGKGFGYVLLKGRALAAKALSLHGKKIQNREIRVQVCGKRTKNKKGEDTHAKHEGRRASAGAASRISKKRAARGEVTTPPPAKKAKVAKDKSAGGKPVVATKATAGDKNKPAKAAPGAVGKAKKFAKDGKNGRKPTTVKGKSGKKVARGPKTPFVKVKKPKHAARKARQAAEAAALAAKSS